MVGSLEETSQQPIMTTFEVAKLLEIPLVTPKEELKKAKSRKKKSA
jgi:hypothetical protein